MATTGRPIAELVVGIRDTAGTVVASGNARFYQPGTLVAQTVYSDEALTTGITQPKVLNAAGQATVYTLEPVRMIVKDSTDTTTYYDGVVNLNRHDSVYVTHTSWNSGTETTLENLLTSLATSMGTGGQYKESSGATARNFVDVLGERTISVKDFGAVGDDSTDDTVAIQAAITRAQARAGSEVFFPKGTYKITDVLGITVAGVSLRGVGRGISIIKQYSSTQSGISVSLAAGTDAKSTIKDLSLTCNTTSSGRGLALVTGTGIIVDNVAIGLFRTSIRAESTACPVELRRVIVESTDGNASAIGFDLEGARCRVANCELTGSSSGSGIDCAGADVRITDSYVTAWTSGIVLSGARPVVRGCDLLSNTTGISSTSGAFNFLCQNNLVRSPTTGITASGVFTVIRDCYVNLASGTAFAVANTDSVISGCIVNSAVTGVNVTGARVTVTDCNIESCTTGIGVGAVANVTVTGCVGVSNTTDLSVNASATLFTENDNAFTATVTDAAASHRFRMRSAVQSTTSSTATATFTPDISNGKWIQRHGSSYAAGAPTITIAAHATATLAIDDLMLLCLYKKGANIMTMSWNAQYVEPDGSAMTVLGPGSEQATAFLFRWDGTNFVLLFRADNVDL